MTMEPRYWSQSKQRFVLIRDMPTPHINNAIAKMERGEKPDQLLIEEMRRELERRSEPPTENTQEEE